MLSITDKLDTCSKEEIRALYLLLMFYAIGSLLELTYLPDNMRYLLKNQIYASFSFNFTLALLKLNTGYIY